MCGKDDLRAAIDHQFERRQGCEDAGVVVDYHQPVLLGHGNVVVHAGQHAFTPKIYVVDGQFGHLAPKKGAESYSRTFECQRLIALNRLKTAGFGHLPRAKLGFTGYMGLGESCDYYGVPFDSLKAHDALYDATKTAELALALLKLD